MHDDLSNLLADWSEARRKTTCFRSRRAAESLFNSANVVVMKFQLGFVGTIKQRSIHVHLYVTCVIMRGRVVLPSTASKSVNPPHPASQSVATDVKYCNVSFKACSVCVNVYRSTQSDTEHAVK